MLRYLAASALVVGLLGCSYEPRIADAYVEKSAKDGSVVTVRISSDVAKTIKRKQLYVALVVVDCQNKEDRYPVEAYIDGQRASRFKYLTTSDYVDIKGFIPSQVLNEFGRPCVFLEGGSYMLGRIVSGTVALVKR
jgi:hypothetical protein